MKMFIHKAASLAAVFGVPIARIYELEAEFRDVCAGRI